jgi:hypothetical protein
MRNESVMTGMRDRAKNKPASAVPLLQRRVAEIKAPWCPATGNVFATPADQVKRASRAHAAAVAPRNGSIQCTGACAGSP